MIKWVQLSPITKKAPDYAPAKAAQHMQAPSSPVTYIALEAKRLKKLQPQAVIAQTVQLQQNTD